MIGSLLNIGMKYLFEIISDRFSPFMTRKMQLYFFSFIQFFTSLENISHLISTFTLLIGGRITCIKLSVLVCNLYKLYICIRAIFFHSAICSPRRQPYKHITQRRRSSLFVYIFHIYYCYSPKDYSQPPPKYVFIYSGIVN